MQGFSKVELTSPCYEILQVPSNTDIQTDGWTYVYVNSTKKKNRQVPYLVEIGGGTCIIPTFLMELLPHFGNISFQANNGYSPLQHNI